MSPPIIVHRLRDVDAFDAMAGAFLAAREAEHNLLLGLFESIRRGTWADPYFAVVRRRDQVIAAALRTPPHNLLLSMVEDPVAVDALLRVAIDDLPDLPGVQAEKETAKAFAAGWTERTGRDSRLRMSFRIFRLTRVVSPRPVTGTMRLATPQDRDRIINWIRAFSDEALSTTPNESGAAAAANFWLATQGLYFWIDGEPVSMAGAAGRTPNGIRISAVYTPPELRGRGYASNLVAAVSQAQLDEGRRFCFLFTDLANPTSNKIYQQIGYEPVLDVDEYRFDAGS